MPCFDKKLEAQRSDFYQMETNSRDVEMVITPVEIENVMEDLCIQFNELQEATIDTLAEFQEKRKVASVKGSGSGGFAYHILQYSAKELFNIELDHVIFHHMKYYLLWTFQHSNLNVNELICLLGILISRKLQWNIKDK
jgi:iron only hydrogenase large subunit-like protein